MLRIHFSVSVHIYVYHDIRVLVLLAYSLTHLLTLVHDLLMIYFMIYS